MKSILKNQYPSSLNSSHEKIQSHLLLSIWTKRILLRCIIFKTKSGQIMCQQSWPCHLHKHTNQISNRNCTVTHLKLIYELKTKISTFKKGYILNFMIKVITYFFLFLCSNYILYQC